MARNLTEVLGAHPQALYAEQFKKVFPSQAGTPPEYIAIAAEAYGGAKASKVDGVRVSNKVASLAETARELGIDPTVHLLTGAEEVANKPGKNKLLATEGVIVTLDDLIQQKRLAEDLEKAQQKPTGIKRV